MRLSVSVLLVFCVLSAQAQKVGMVMSGGGAKGLAHVGVLKALEENDIPIDYITGTSMGAVVGAFYAAGYSPEQIEELALSPGFIHWINGTASEKYIYNYTKSEDTPSWVTLNALFNSKLGLMFNTPLANDLVINFVLNEYMSQASQKSGDDFDKLFVPYRAMAAEIFSQKAVSLDTGSLMMAVRSSMAVPFFYSPIKLDGKFMFDGGIYNNFPVEAMNESFAPDVVIGANVAEKLREDYPYSEDEEKLQDAMLFLFLDKVDTAKLLEKDIYLEPDLEGRTALDFDEAAFLIKAGYEATMARMDQIKAKIGRRSAKADLLKKREDFQSGLKDLTFGRMDLFGFEPKQKKFLEGLISFEKGNRSLGEVRDAYFQLVSEPYFGNVYPVFRFDSKGQYYVLELHTKRAAQGTLSADIGGNLSTRSISALSLGLSYNRLGRFLNTYKVRAITGRFYESFHMATRFNLSPQRRLFVEPAFTFNQWNFLDNRDFLNDRQDPNILERIDRKLGVVAGMGTGSRSVITAGAYLLRNTDEFSNTATVSTDASLDQLDFMAFRANLSYERNSLNLKQFPTQGTRFYTSLDFFSGTTEYIPGSTSVLYNPNVPMLFETRRDWFRVKFQFEEYSQVSDKYTFGWDLDAVYSSQPLFSNFRSSLLYANAYYPMFDSKTFFLDNYRAFSYVGAGMKHIFTLGKALKLRGELYAFSPFKRLVELDRQMGGLEEGFDTVYFTGMAALVYDTLLGPVSLRLNYYEEDEAFLGLMFSFGYLIFNSKSDE